MVDHRKLPIKYCETCEFHFRARPDTHEEVYHPGGDWSFVNGDWKKAERLSQYRVDGELS